MRSSRDLIGTVVCGGPSGCLAAGSAPPPASSSKAVIASCLIWFDALSPPVHKFILRSALRWAGREGPLKTPQQTSPKRANGCRLHGAGTPPACAPPSLSAPGCPPAPGCHPVPPSRTWSRLLGIYTLYMISQLGFEQSCS